ncbi:unnamed protein product [Lota lota]
MTGDGDKPAVGLTRALSWLNVSTLSRQTRRLFRSQSELRPPAPGRRAPRSQPRSRSHAHLHAGGEGEDGGGGGNDDDWVYEPQHRTAAGRPGPVKRHRETDVRRAPGVNIGRNERLRASLASKQPISMRSPSHPSQLIGRQTDGVVITPKPFAFARSSVVHWPPGGCAGKSGNFEKKSNDNAVDVVSAFLCAAVCMCKRAVISVATLVNPHGSAATLAISLRLLRASAGMYWALCLFPTPPASRRRDLLAPERTPPTAPRPFTGAYLPVMAVMDVLAAPSVYDKERPDRHKYVATFLKKVSEAVYAH